LRADAALTVGNVNQLVTVDAANAGVIQTETASIDASLSAVAVLDLPATIVQVRLKSPLGIIQALPVFRRFIRQSVYTGGFVPDRVFDRRYSIRMLLATRRLPMHFLLANLSLRYVWMEY